MSPLPILIISCLLGAAAGTRTCTVVNGISGACDLHLNDFTFAGAHNAGSGSFGGMKYQSGARVSDCWYRNQDKSITGMLDIGIRYFDFDVAYIRASKDDGDWWEEGIVLVHKDAYSRSLRRALVEIDDFLGSNPDEIVIIRIKDYRDWAEDLIRNSLDTELQIFKKTGLHSSRNPRLGDAIATNKRVVMFLNGGLGSHANTHSLAQIESYKNAGATFGCWKAKFVYERLLDNSEIRNRYYQVQVDWYHSYGLCYKKLAGLCDDDELDKIYQIYEKVLEESGRPVNLVLQDYVGGSRLGEIVKRMNINNVNVFLENNM